MSSNAPTPGSDPVPTPAKLKRSLASVLALPLLLVVVGGGVYAYFYFTNPEPPPVGDGALLNGYVTNADRLAKLADGYTDADGDLVADTPADAKEPAELFFTEIPGSTPDADEKTWEPFLKHMTAATGGKPCKYLKKVPLPAGPPPTPVAPEPGEEPPPPGAPDAAAGAVKTFAAQLSALRAGQLHVTAFTTGQVREAVNTAGFVPLAVPADKDGKFSYTVEVIVRADSPIKTVADLRGTKFGVSALSSNSGAKAPFVMFHDEFQLNPRTDYKVMLTGGYKNTLKVLLEGKIDATCVASDLLAREKAAGTLKDADVRVIHQSKEFPKLCFGVSHALPKKLRDDILAGLTSFPFAGNTVGEKYKPDGVTRFRPVNYKADWQSVRTVDDRLVEILTAK